MNEEILRDLISDLEIVNRNLQIVSEKSDNDDEEKACLFRESYHLTKRAIQTLSEEEVRLEMCKSHDA